MVVFLLVLIALATLHFVYENILVPSLRLRLRFRLFELRDRLRILKLEHSDEISEELFDSLQLSINRSIKILHQIDLKTLYWLYKTVEIENAAPEITKRAELIAECSITEIRKLYRSLMATVGFALVVNNGALLFYVLPVLIGILSFSQIKKWIKILLNISEAEVSKITIESPVIA